VAIIEDIKCGRCDRKYSGVRSRCPYCGARRIGRGKYSESSDNTKGKMMISVLIMSVLVVAFAVLLFSADAAETTPQPPENGGLAIPGEDDTTTVDSGLAPPPTPTPEPTPEPEPEPTPMPISQLRVTNAGGGSLPGGGAAGYEFTMTRVRESIGLRIQVEPPGAVEDYQIVWESSNDEVFDVVPTRLTEGGQIGLGATVTAIGSGHETLTVTLVPTGPGSEGAPSISAEVTVRVRVG